MGKLIDLTNKRFGKLIVLEKSKNKINNRPAWKCKCDCGNISVISGHSLRTGNSKSCGKCLRNTCIGEQHNELTIIGLDLEKTTEKEKTFSTCKFPDTNYPAFFDFWVENKYIIEFDGKQHFYETNLFSYPLSKIHEHDSYKNNWCKENNIPIIRIPYTYQEKITIEDLLLESSNFLLKG